MTMKRKIISIEIISTFITVLVVFLVSCFYINRQNYKTAEDELLTYSNNVSLPNLFPSSTNPGLPTTEFSSKKNYSTQYLIFIINTFYTSIIKINF